MHAASPTAFRIHLPQSVAMISADRRESPELADFLDYMIGRLRPKAVRMKHVRDYLDGLSNACDQIIGPDKASTSTSLAALEIADNWSEISRRQA
jgi:hypothetical protein